SDLGFGILLDFGVRHSDFRWEGLLQQALTSSSPLATFSQSQSANHRYSLPAAKMIGRNSFIISANTSKETCCLPSLQAFEGSGCTSMSSASAPMATAPLHIALTKSARPAPWLG